MAINLLDLFTTQYNESLIRQSSGALGETADSITAGIDIASKAVLSGIVSKARSQGGVDEWVYGAVPSDWSQLTQVPTDDIFIQPNLDHFTNAGSSILRNLFGDKQNAIIDYVSGHARLKTSSSSTLLKVIAALFLRTIANHRAESSLGRMDTRKVLDEQASYLRSALPIDLQPQLGLSDQFTVPHVEPGLTSPSDPTASPMHVSKVLPWIILLLTSLGLFYFVEKGCGGNSPAQEDNQEIRIDSTKQDSI
jgi:OOP family OmpA-OmpF porin